MFKNVFTSLTVAIFTVALFAPVTMFPTDAAAKSFGGGGFKSSSFSRSSIRSSSGSSSKSMFSSYKPKTSSTNTSTTKYSTTKNSSGTAAAQTKYTTNKQVISNHKFDGKKHNTGFTNVAAGKQTRVAKSALTAQRNKFKKPVTPTGSKPSSVTYTKTYGTRTAYRKASTYDRGTYYSRRNQYYGNYTPPVYVYNTSPSYGMWDTIFLYSMLSSMNNNNHAASFAYNHQNDADYQSWRREADKLAQDNAELRAQLAQLDAKASGMTGTRNPDYIPDGIDADLAMSQEVLDSQKPTLRVCVASKNGTYFRVTAGVLMQGINSVNIVPVTTQGTSQILEYLAEDKCDAGFAQGDGYWNYVEAKHAVKLPFERVSSPYKEAVHLICREDGPKSISDLDSDNRVWFPAKSGAAETWRNFIGEDKDYAKIKTVLNDSSMNVNSYEEAVTKITNDKNSCAMYVGAVGASKFIKNIDAGAKNLKLVLRDVDDGALDNTEDPSGVDVYTFKDVEGYKNLNRAGGCYGYCSGDIKTLFVNADFLVTNKWKSANNETYATLASDLMGMQPEIEMAVMAH